MVVVVDDGMTPTIRPISLVELATKEKRKRGKSEGGIRERRFYDSIELPWFTHAQKAH